VQAKQIKALAPLHVSEEQLSAVCNRPQREEHGDDHLTSLETELSAAAKEARPWQRRHVSFASRSSLVDKADDHVKKPDAAEHLDGTSSLTRE
jgi:hypothetical protein